jgi:hypothetical protein
VGGGRGGAVGSWVDGQVSGERSGVVCAGNNGEPVDSVSWEADGWGRRRVTFFFFSFSSHEPNAKRKN